MIYILRNIDEKDVSSVEKGDKVDVTIDGEDSDVDGKVEEVGQATLASH